MRQGVIETERKPMIRCNGIADLATLCALLFKEGITFDAETVRLTITLKGF